MHAVLSSHVTAQAAQAEAVRSRLVYDRMHSLCCSRRAGEAGGPGGGHNVGQLLGRYGLGRGERVAALQELLLLAAGSQQGQAAADAGRLGA